MKIERLRNKKNKLIFLCGFLVVVVLLITLVFKGSKAKYRNSQIVPLINTKVKNNVPSFTTMGIYLETSSDTAGAEEKGGKYYNKQKSDFIIPEGYKINDTNSYCNKFDKDKSILDTNAKMYTNYYDEHIFFGISEGDKCYVYLDKGFVNPNSIKAQLLTKWGYVGKVVTERNDLGTVRTDTGNKVYKTLDNDGTSYYLVGDPDNNWVKFGGYYWRIVRINGDGTLRMIYQGRTKDESGNNLSATKTGAETEIGVGQYNEQRGSTEYVGYFYKLGEQRGLETASTIYEKVNKFYSDNLTNVDIDKYIDKNAGFCNDRTIVKGTGGLDVRTEYISMTNMTNFKCTDNLDLFTSKVASKGNQRLEYPIGLITMGEVALGGSSSSWEVESNTMFRTNRLFWTMSPGSGFTHNGIYWSYVFLVMSNGALEGSWYVDNWPTWVKFGIRPVINLVKDVTFSKGNGSISSPFEI